MAMSWIMLIAYAVFIVLIFMILFTGTVGVTGIRFTMIPGITLHGITHRGRGVGEAITAGTAHIIPGVGDTAHIIPGAGVILITTMDMEDITTVITMDTVQAGGMPIQIITSMEGEELQVQMFTAELTDQGELPQVWPATVPPEIKAVNLELRPKRIIQEGTAQVPV